MGNAKRLKNRVSGGKSGVNALEREGVACEKRAEKAKHNRMGGQSLAQCIIALIEAARQKVAAVANLAQVYTNYEIGRQIVEEEQGGKRRADYGAKMLIDLSAKLIARFGRGWSVRSLRILRRFSQYTGDIM